MAAKVLILFLTNFALSYSFAVVSIRNINEDDLVDELVKALNKRTSNVSSHIEVRSARKDLHDAHSKYEMKREINSRIPYGHLNTKLDINKEPIFQTLIRLRKKKPIFIKDKDAIKIQDNIARAGGSSYFSFSFPNGSMLEVTLPPGVHNNFDWKKWIPPLHPGSSEPFDWEKWLSSIPKPHYDWQKWIPPFLHKENDGNEAKSDKRTKSEKTFSSFWQNMKDLKNQYREVDTSKSKRKKSKMPKIMRTARSGEEHDPLAPGKVPFNIDLHEETTTKPDRWLPHYPYWNYWTYDKTLYQDACKGSSIKVGDWCIRPPPH